jgi:hypothetical protein
MFVDVVVYASIFLFYIIYIYMYIYIVFQFCFLVELGLRNNWDQPDSTCIIVYIYVYMDTFLRNNIFIVTTYIYTYYTLFRKWYHR